MKVLALVIALALLAVSPARQQQPFRTATDVVILEAAVLQNNTPVTGLTARDFIVTDNGVRQTVEAVSAEALPVDLSLILDTSGSMTDTVEQLTEQLTVATGHLRADDHLRFLQFGWGVREVFAMQPPASRVSLDKFTAGGATSFHDALAAALMRVRRPGRAELAVVFTDAVDTSSAMTLEATEELARRSDVLLHAFIVRPPEAVAIDVMILRPDYRPLADLVALTGGGLEVMLADKHVVTGLSRAISEFRSRYSLRFTATGVPRAGWHELVVTIDRPGGFVVRARRGYFGG